MRSKLTTSGPGLEKLREITRQLEVRPEIQLGVLGGKGAQAVEGEDLTMAELAAIHEFGAPRAGVPERSWLRSTADEQRAAWMALLERSLSLALRGRIDVNAALELVGQRAVAGVVRKVRSNIPPPLKPATIARKGSSRALIDTGRFVQSISYEVVSGRQTGR